MEGRKTVEEILVNLTQGSQCHSGWCRKYCWCALKFYLLWNLLGKLPSYSAIKMFNMAPLLSYSSPNIHDSWHNSLDYRWVSLGLDKLWCNSDRMIVTWILMQNTWDQNWFFFSFFFLKFGLQHDIYHFLCLYHTSNHIPVNHSIPLIVGAHTQKQTTASQKNGQRRLLLLLPDQNRSGKPSQKQPCICVWRLAFSEEIHFSHIAAALSLPDTLCQKLSIYRNNVCLRAALFPSTLSDLQVMGLLLTASGLCDSHQDKSIYWINVQIGG